MLSLIREDELTTLVIGLSVLLFIFLKRSELKSIPSIGILIFSYIVLIFGWVFTILEGFFLRELVNILEHSCYTISAALLTFWCYTFFYPAREKK